MFSSTLDPGIAVNVNGSYGILTADPQNNQYVVDVNTTGRPVYGQPLGGTGSIASNAIAGLPGWLPLVVIIGIFAAAIGLLGGRK